MEFIVVSILLGLASPQNASTAVRQNSKITKEEKSLYEQALRSIRKEDWNDALLRMEHFVRYFHESPLADNAIYWMAQIYVQKDEFNLARDELARIIRDYPESDRAHDALSLLENINLRRFP